MEIGWTDVGSEGYILVSYAYSNSSFYLVHLTQRIMMLNPIFNNIWVVYWPKGSSELLS